MPTPFSRLGRHSNRSHHALPDTPAAPIAAAAVVSGGTVGAVPGQTQQTASAASAASASNTASTTTIPESPALSNPPYSTLSSNPAFNSSQSSFAEVRSQHPYKQSHQSPAQQATQPPPLSQLQLQQQTLPPTPVGGSAHPLSQPQHHQLYAGPPESASTDSPVADGSQPPDWVEAAVNRSQSQRYSTFASIPQQQQRHLQSQAYIAASASLEDLPSTSDYSPHNQQLGGAPHHPEHSQGQVSSQYLQQQAAQPEKKSRRKLIRGIFSSKSNYENHYQPGQNGSAPGPGHSQGHQQAHQTVNSYDNTAGLARRPSKRQSNPPVLNTRLGQPNQELQSAEWSTHVQHGADSSPRQLFGVFEEQQNLGGGDSQRDAPVQEGHASIGPTTIRTVNNDSDSSPYEDKAYQQAHQSQQTQQTQHQTQQQTVPGPHPQQQAQYPPAPPSKPHAGQLLHQHQQQGQSHRFDQSPSDQQSTHSPPLQVQQVPQLQQAQQSQQPQQQYHYAGVNTQPPFSPRTDSRFLPTHLATTDSLQQSQEALSHTTQDYSPARDSDYGHTAQSSPGPYEYTPQPHDIPPTPGQSSVPQVTTTTAQQAAMPPPGAQSASRRSAQDSDKAQPPLGPPPGYRQPNTSSGTLTPLPQGHTGPQPGAFNGSDQGRHSPQPEPQAPDGEKAFKDLLTKYKNVKRLYFDGKAQIENLTSQVEQLQNAVANQRMSQSRTALDDNEYAGRFSRLNGAINNLSFNIRKDWRGVPDWLTNFISADALKTGKQEMTAVGRAVISRWLVDELFNRVFHPGLEPGFSQQLKLIELNIRGNAYTMNSQEEFDALTNKIVQWRMATLDGLHQFLQSKEAAENRQNLTDKATESLTGSLYQFLNDPPPPGVDSSTSMIVELAIGIVANLPMESRDVVIAYPLPGEIVRPSHMDVEKGELPAPEGFEPLSDSDDEAEKDPKNVTKAPPRVRFAGFVTLEVRGRQVLMKAPIWTL